MKLLVTGGAGYVGSVATAQPLETGHEVVVFDNLSTRSGSAVPEGARLVQGDLLDTNGLGGVLAAGFEGVLHFAALSVVGESVEPLTPGTGCSPTPPRTSRSSSVVERWWPKCRRAERVP